MEKNRIKVYYTKRRGNLIPQLFLRQNEKNIYSARFILSFLQECLINRGGAQLPITREEENIENQRHFSFM